MVQLLLLSDVVPTYFARALVGRKLSCTVAHADDVTGLKKQLNAATAAIQGSGWGWLGYNPTTKKLEIVTTPNQDPLLCKPLLRIPAQSAQN